MGNCIGEQGSISKMYKNSTRKQTTRQNFGQRTQSRYCSKAEMQMNRYLKTSSASLVAMEMQSKIIKSYYTTRVQMPMIKMTKARVGMNV